MQEINPVPTDWNQFVVCACKFRSPKLDLHGNFVVFIVCSRAEDLLDCRSNANCMQPVQPRSGTTF